MAQAPSLAAGVADVPDRLTFEEFLALAEPERAEWVDGVVIPMASVTVEHARIVAFLGDLMRRVAAAFGAGEIFQDPFVMRLPGLERGRAPDIMFVAREHLDRLRENYLDGPADFAVEVMSPGSRGLDRGEKFYEYEAAGIREYWLIDPGRRVAEFYRLDAEGHYGPVAVEEGVVRSEVLAGFWLKVDWLWERPPLAQAEAELGLR